MMNIDPRNEIILLKMLSIYKEVYKYGLPEYHLVFNDQDDCKYKLTYLLDKEQFHFSFYCKHYDDIYNINGSELLTEKYPDFLVDAPEEGYNLTLALDCKGLPKPGGTTLQKYFNIIEKDDKERKALIKKSEEEFFDKYSNDLSLFKRNFFASPFEKLFNNASSAKLDMSDKIEYSPSENEAVWIIPEDDKLSVFIAIHFDDITDKTIAKLILSEMEEAKRHVKNSPAIQKMHEDKIPDLLKSAFPNSQLLTKKYSNGLIGITLFKKHYSENLSTCATMLSQFRQYLKYHIHASKTYLHGRIRRRVGQLQKVNNQAKFEEEGKKVYRSNKGKNIEVNLKEEEKGPQSLLIKK